MSIPLTIDLGKHIFCNSICSKWCLVLIWVFYLIHACIQDGIFTGIYNSQPILFPQMSHQLRTFRSIIVCWYGNFHVQVCVIIHISDEVIVGLCKTGIFYYVVKILLEVRVVFQLLIPVFCVSLFCIICEVLLSFEAPVNFNIKFIDARSCLICLILWVGEYLNCC